MLEPTPLPSALETATAALALWLFFLNVGTYGLIRLDHRRAMLRGRRMSESVLLWLALLGGWPGLLLALGERTGVRHSDTFRGWISGAIMAQALFLGLAVLPQGSFVAAGEKALAFVLQGARAAEGRAEARRIVLDSERGTGGLTKVVPLSGNP